MRNIALTATAITSLPNANVTATTIDIDENVLYAASERQSPDADVQVDIWKVPLTEEGSAGGQVSFHALLNAQTKCIMGHYLARGSGVSTL